MGGGLKNVLAAAPLPDFFHTTGQASFNLPILFSETRRQQSELSAAQSSAFPASLA